MTPFVYGIALLGFADIALAEVGLQQGAQLQLGCHGG